MYMIRILMEDNHIMSIKRFDIGFGSVNDGLSACQIEIENSSSAIEFNRPLC